MEESGDRSLYEAAVAEARDHPIAWGGGIAGAASELQEYVADIPLYEDYLNPLQLDHTVMHPGFNVFLGYASDRALAFAVDHPSLAQKTVASGAVMAAFTAAKEGWYDASVEYLDVAGNVAGWGFYRGSDYGWDQLADDAKSTGQALYDRVR